MQHIEIEQLVVNWHVTAACNYRCRYCYASWTHAAATREVWRDAPVTERLLASLWDAFSPNTLVFPLGESLGWNSVRLSLAGGEPTLLGDHLTEIAAHARNIGFAVSLITNGSRPDVVIAAAPYLDMIGFSVDSADLVTNTDIGRADPAGVVVSEQRLQELIAQVREVNPNIVIKINTVVSLDNAEQDLSTLIGMTRPDRWKIMRMLPVVTDDLAVTQLQFRSFVDRHIAFREMMSVEDNPDMERSYVMIDPYGRFFQNRPGKKGYLYSQPILEVGAKAAFLQVPFCLSGFAGRYGSCPVASPES